MRSQSERGAVKTGFVHCAAKTSQWSMRPLRCRALPEHRTPEKEASDTRLLPSSVADEFSPATYQNARDEFRCTVLTSAVTLPSSDCHVFENMSRPEIVRLLQGDTSMTGRSLVAFITIGSIAWAKSGLDDPVDVRMGLSS
eukprot:scaffold172_cov254-Pinguiococcus_pyrenoidosus.AAC.25